MFTNSMICLCFILILLVTLWRVVVLLNEFYFTYTYKLWLFPIADERVGVEVKL